MCSELLYMKDYISVSYQYTLSFLYVGHLTDYQSLSVNSTVTTHYVNVYFMTIVLCNSSVM